MEEGGKYFFFWHKFLLRFFQYAFFMLEFIDLPFNLPEDHSWVSAKADHIAISIFIQPERSDKAEEIKFLKEFFISNAWDIKQNDSAWAD